MRTLRFHVRDLVVEFEAGHRFKIRTKRPHTLNSGFSWNDPMSEIVDELSVALDLLNQMKMSKNGKDQNYCPPPYHKTI